MERLKRNLKYINAVSAVMPPLVLIIFILLFWQLNCVINNIPAWQLPKPSDIILAFFSEFTETLPYLASTYFNIIIGFILSVAIGIVLALIQIGRASCRERV